jgi:hypothetical protein
MSILPKALAAILAPYADIPRTYLEPLREIIVHNPWCGGRGKRVSWWDSASSSTRTKQKIDEDPVDVSSLKGITPMKTKKILKPADLV